MENIQLISIATSILLLFGIVVFFSSRKKNKEFKQDKVSKEVGKLVNQRGDFRLRLEIEDALMEVIKIGDIDVAYSEVCEIVDVSASGMGIYSDNDYPVRNKVLVKLLFKLNDKEFTMDGILVRKVETSNKEKILYGINFMNLSDGNENRLLKEIAAIENNRRKIKIK